jgi:hypothetical protein
MKSDVRCTKEGGKDMISHTTQCTIPTLLYPDILVLPELPQKIDRRRFDMGWRRCPHRL